MSLSASGARPGRRSSFNPASVTSGGSSTMTVNAGASTAPGSYTITVTGTAASGSHTTTVALERRRVRLLDLGEPEQPQRRAGTERDVDDPTAVLSGAAQSVSLSASGQPAG